MCEFNDEKNVTLCGSKPVAYLDPIYDELYTLVKVKRPEMILYELYTYLNRKIVNE